MRGLDGLARREDTKRLHAEYLRRIDAEAVLAHYGAENGIRKGDEVIHSCLLDRVDQHHNNGDQNPSASMNLEKKLYSCYSFGGGDIFWLIAQMEGKEEFHEIVPMLGPFLTGGATETAEEFLDELEKYFTKGQGSALVMPKLHERVLRNWDFYHPYLKDRGVSLDAAQRLRVGYDQSQARIVFPHWVDGQLVGWQKRSLTDERWPQTQPDENGRIHKYQSSSGMPKAESLYNYDLVVRRGKRQVIVVESPMSVLRAETLLRDDDDPLAGVLGTFGAKVTEHQLKLLRNFDEVTLFTDHDTAGRASSFKMMDGLYRHTKVFHVEPEEGMDMADYTERSDLDRILSTREPAVLALARMEPIYGNSKRRRR
ncbi:DNA primase [Rhodococcus phage Finch]|uniref:DNA primase n=1 Tax=Rhodococcus phage Finch TaxID=2094144 RepID=A0A2P1JXH3_9CAUD|nr:DNA primase [Rhodococcus phage Finch]AVO25010.1 DNA primase [Rhodococcus phage Finch]